MRTDAHMFLAIEQFSIVCSISRLIVNAARNATKLVIFGLDRTSCISEAGIAALYGKLIIATVCIQALS